MKPKMLLHVCCGPCSVAIFEELLVQFDLVVHFYNPNIHPQAEYEKRKREVIKLCRQLNIPFVEDDYSVDEWFEKTKDFADEPEGGRRCPVCFELRLDRAASYAAGNGFEYFATSLTSGRNKLASIINPIGIDCGKRHGIIFYEEDWKKKGRQQVADEMVREKGIYRQDYCGCIYSKRKNKNYSAA